MSRHCCNGFAVRADPNTEVLVTAIFSSGYFGFIMPLDTNAVLPDPTKTSDQASSDHTWSKAAANASRASIAAIHVRAGPNTEALTTAVFLGGYFESNVSQGTYAVLPDPLMTSDQASSDHHVGQKRPQMLSEQILLLRVRADPNTEVLTAAVFLGVQHVPGHECGTP